METELFLLLYYSLHFMSIYLLHRLGALHREYVTKTWSVVLLNKKNTYTAISSLLCMTSC